MGGLFRGQGGGWQDEAPPRHFLVARVAGFGTGHASEFDGFENPASFQQDKSANVLRPSIWGAAHCDAPVEPSVQDVDLSDVQCPPSRVEDGVHGLKSISARKRILVALLDMRKALLDLAQSHLGA